MIRTITTKDPFGSPTRMSRHVVSAIGDLQHFLDGTTAGMLAITRILISRFCGRVVCYRCSSSRRPIPVNRVVQNPFFSESDDPSNPGLHRVCDTCVPLVQQLSHSPPRMYESSESVASISIPSSTGPHHLYDAQSSMRSDVEDSFLIECPVCHLDLRQFSDDDAQAAHVVSCLEDHSASPSFNGGSRHLGMCILTIETDTSKSTSYRKEVP
jgi:hypothetical protein